MLRSSNVRRLSDEELCDLVRAGGKPRSHAFAELYKRYRDTAMAQAYTMTGDRTVAEDLVEETFARVLRALSRGHGPRESVLGYVLVALRSEAIRSYHAEAETVSVAPESLAEMTDESLPDISESLSERDQISRAFATLPEDVRQVLWLLDVELVPMKDAARHLEISVGALRVLAHRSRKKLATSYLQQYVEISDPACRKIAEILAEYTRKSLGKRAEARVDAHVQQCPHCSAQVARLRSLQQQLRSFAGFLIPGGIAMGVLSSGVDTTTAHAVDFSDHGRREAVRSLVGGLGITAGVTLVLAGVVILAPKDTDMTSDAGGTGSASHQESRVPGDSDSFLDAGPSAGSRRSSVHEGTSALVPWFDSYGGRDQHVLPPLSGRVPVLEDDDTPNWKLRED